MHEGGNGGGETEASLRFIMDAMAVSVAHCRADLRFQFVNRAYASRFGLIPGQIVGRTIPDVLGAEAFENIRPYIERVLRGESVQYEATVHYRTLGPRYAHCSYTPEAGPDGRIVGWVASILDMTDRRRLEDQVRQLNQTLEQRVEELKRAEESLREADRRKDEFLATLAHELRNPLAPIRSAVQILQLQGPQEPALKWARGVIDRQAEQLGRLVDDLLDVSRITRGRVELRPERVDLAAVVERALETSRPLIEGSRHRLSVTVEDGALALEADATRLAQVLSNLLNNAAKYTQPGGHIQLSAGHEDGQAVIRVRDNGIGIPPQVLPRIFDMFAQADTSLERAQGGLGLGLTIAKRLVEMHGGTLEAASAGEGQGSELTVRLPLAPSLAPPAAEPPREEPQGPADGRRTILVVDDNQDSADSLTVWLRLTGYDALTAHNGPEALALAREHRPGVVLLDIGMPGMSGYEVARRLREMPETSGALLVALTGWGQDEDRRRSGEAGFDHHLVKPLDHASLQKLLDQPDGSR